MGRKTNQGEGRNLGRDDREFGKRPMFSEHWRNKRRQGLRNQREIASTYTTKELVAMDKSLEGEFMESFPTSFLETSAIRSTWRHETGEMEDNGVVKISGYSEKTGRDK